MTLDEAISIEDRLAKEQHDAYNLCPLSDQGLCTGTGSCSALKHGEDRGCLKVARQHEQLSYFLKDYKQMKDKWEYITSKYDLLVGSLSREVGSSEALEKIDEFCIIEMRGLLCDYYADRLRMLKRSE